MPKNQIFAADNLSILTDKIASESVDLVYLDPPFNSKKNYNVLFRERQGGQSSSQHLVFKDTWKWTGKAEDVCKELIESGGGLAEAIKSLRVLLGSSDMMAYLVMMAPRLRELHRVLKNTGSIYLHCDSTASHYLKVLMDGVFGPQQFRNEIIWKRADAHNDAKRQFGMTSDRLLFYTKTGEYTFNPQHGNFQERTLRDWYQYLEFPDGAVRRMTKRERETQEIPAGARRFNTDNLRSPNPRPNLTYTYKGYKPHKNGWAVCYAKMEELDKQGLLLFPSSKDGRIMRKRYLEKDKGPVLGDVWTDVSQLRGADAERLLYPTQKPLALLERIIKASSNEGNVILDPFCGCGTAIEAAQILERRWIGIDVTLLAVAVIKTRLTKFGPAIFRNVKITGEPITPEEAESLAETDKFGFQWWAVGRLGAPPIEEKKGRDRGVDGRIYFHDDAGAAKHIVISVKAGQVGPAAVRELRGVIERDAASMGILVTVHQKTREMEREAASAGTYKSINGVYPKLQIVTVEDIFCEKPIELPGKKLNPYEPKKPTSVAMPAEQLRLLP